MRKILNSFSPLVIKVRINKKPIFAIINFYRFVIASIVRVINQILRAILNSCRFVLVGLIKITKQIIYTILASFRFVIASLVRINKKIIHAISNAFSFVIASLIKIRKQIIYAVLVSLHTILSSFRFLITSLVTLNRQLFRATLAFLHTTVSFFDIVISSLVRLIKQVISAVLNSCRLVIATLVRVNKRLFHAIITSLNLLITGIVNITKQVIYAMLVSFRFVIASLVNINKRIFRAAAAFLHAAITSLRKILASCSSAIASLVTRSKQLTRRILLTFLHAITSSTINSCRFVIDNLFKIQKKFMRGAAFFGIAIVSSSSFMMDSLIRINKQVISWVVNGILSSFGTIVSFLGAFLYSLGALVNSFSAGAIILGTVIAAVLVSLVRINKKLIHGVRRRVVNSLSAVLSSMGFVLTSLVRINKQVISSLVRIIKQVIHATVAFPRFVVTGLVRIGRFTIKDLIKITKLLFRVILFPFIFVITNLVKVVKAVLASLRFVTVTDGTNKRLLRKILAWGSFVIFSVIVIVAFMTAKTYVQLAAAILLYPLFAYFAFRAFPRKARMRPLVKPATVIQSPAISAEKIEVIAKENVRISDIDKRAFLKMIGGTGLILFLLSIFNKSAGGLLPGIVPAGSGLTLLKDTAGNKIDPAQNQPLDGYRISEVDDNSAVTFYGFINKDGAWFIMKGDADTGSFRYAKGNLDFPDNWARRESLKYDYFYKLF